MTGTSSVYLPVSES